ncbi:MAG: peptidoglycan DD-metalloendopeptidase family protein [Hyphomicrobiaceae bacterium]|nr:peptidoglycan DD-metalloendopeptidase family protein [Hyphomicrobiaceae bacterium]
MPNGVLPLAARVGVVALLAGLSAGCSSDAQRFNIFSGRDGPDPTVTASIPASVPMAEPQAAPTQQPLPAPIVTQPAVQAAPVTPVWTTPAMPVATRQPLPAPIASAPTAITPQVPQQIAAVPAAQAPIYTGSIPQTPVSTAPAEGWTAAGGTRINAGQGETLFTLSRRYGVPVAALQQANGISDPNQVVAGQTVVIPTYVYSPRTVGGSAATVAPQPVAATETTASIRETAPTASVPVAPATHSVPAPAPRPASETRAAAPSTVQPGGSYVVASGDTLYGIARRHGVSTSQLMAANGIADANQIRIGQRLVIPGATTVAAVTPTATPTRTAPAQPAAYTPPAPSPAPAVAAPAATVRQEVVARTPDPVPAASAPTAEPAQAPSTGALAFRWPIRGHVISGYGPRATGGRNDGINIAVPEGALIRAAEDGEVVYAGSGLRGFGNLVLVQHRDGWVTAYAHNSELLVQRGQRVRRGENIARAGRTGDVDTPQLHFEIRQGNTPVDPSPLLQQL